MGRNIISRFVPIFVSKIGVLMLTVLTTPILVRLLGSGGYGDYSFLLSTLQWLLVFVYAGAFDGIRKYIAEDPSNDEWTNSVFSFYFRIVSVFITVISSIILIFSRTDFLISILGEDFSLYFIFIALMVPLKALFRISRSGLMGFSLESYSEPLQIVDRFSFAGFIAIILYTGSSGNVAVVLGSRMIAMGLATGLALFFIQRRVDLSKILHQTPNIVPRRQLVTYSVSTMTLSFLMLSLYHIDIILLRILVGNAETGYYRAALVVAEFLWFVPIAMQITLLHSTSQLWSERQYEQLTEISSRVVRYTLLFTSLLVIGTAGLAEPFLTLYFGPEFDAAVVPLLLLLPGALGFAVARPIFAISQGQENLRMLIFVTGVSALINVVMNVVLIPRFGVNGAAVATSTAYGSMFFLHVWNARQLGFNPVRNIRIKKVSITVLLAAIPIIGLPQLIESSLLAITTIPLLGLLLFMSLAIVTEAIRIQEIIHLMSKSPIPMNQLTEWLPERIANTINDKS